jgi:hypothetical protein
MMKRAVCAMFFLLIGNFAIAQEAPFGLYWGEDAQKIKSRSVVLIEKRRDGAFTQYHTTSTPRHLSSTETYSLLVHDRYGLVKITSYSRNISNDIAGIDGKRIYNELKAAISDKYGPAKDQFEYSGRKLYKEYDEFYQCLRYQGCGTWSSFWGNAEGRGAISVELKGLTRGVGFVVLSYEGPNFDKAIEERTTTDKGVL